MKLIIVLLAFFHFQSFAIDNTPKQLNFCGVIGMYAVSPDGQLEQFLFAGSPQCYDKKFNPDISKDWLKAACGYFTTQQHDSTYQKGEKQNWNSKIFYYLPTRPDVVFPNKDSGSSVENPVVYVKESILGDSHKFCDGVLHTM